MRSILVRLGSCFRCICFIQKKAAGIVGTLQNIEPQIARLTDRTIVVFYCGGNKIVEMLFFDIYGNACYYHVLSFCKTIGY